MAQCTWPEVVPRKKTGPKKSRSTGAVRPRTDGPSGVSEASTPPTRTRRDRGDHGLSNGPPSRSHRYVCGIVPMRCSLAHRGFLLQRPFLARSASGADGLGPYLTTSVRHPFLPSSLMCHLIDRRSGSTGDTYLSPQHQQYTVCGPAPSGLPVNPEMASSYHTPSSGDHCLSPQSSPYMSALEAPSPGPRGPWYRQVAESQYVGRWHQQPDASHGHPSQTYASPPRYITRERAR